MMSDALMKWIKEHIDFIETHTAAERDDPYEYVKFSAIHQASCELEGEYFPEKYTTSKYEQIFSLCINNRDEGLKLLKTWYNYHIIGGDLNAG